MDDSPLAVSRELLYVLAVSVEIANVARTVHWLQEYVGFRLGDIEHDEIRTSSKMKATEIARGKPITIGGRDEAILPGVSAVRDFELFHLKLCAALIKSSAPPVASAFVADRR